MNNIASKINYERGADFLAAEWGGLLLNGGAQQDSANKELNLSIKIHHLPVQLMLLANLNMRWLIFCRSAFACPFNKGN